MRQLNNKTAKWLNSSLHFLEYKKSDLGTFQLPFHTFVKNSACPGLLMLSTNCVSAPCDVDHFSMAPPEPAKSS